MHTSEQSKDVERICLHSKVLNLAQIYVQHFNSHFPATSGDGVVPLSLCDQNFSYYLQHNQTKFSMGILNILNIIVLNLIQSKACSYPTCPNYTKSIRANQKVGTWSTLHPVYNISKCTCAEKPTTNHTKLPKNHYDIYTLRRIATSPVCQIFRNLHLCLGLVPTQNQCIWGHLLLGNLKKKATAHCHKQTVRMYTSMPHGFNLWQKIAIMSKIQNCCIKRNQVNDHMNAEHNY